MTGERRYSDDEVKTILDLAITRNDSGPVAPVHESGLTLGDLQEVAREVGVAPDRITEAALALDARPQVLPNRTAMGLPFSVGRIVPLPRALNDHEWDVLVSDLRETFRARGRVTSHKGVREWSNGKLHAFVEPTETGHRLRLGTEKSGAKVLVTLGALGLALGTVVLPVLLLLGISLPAVDASGFLTLAMVAAFAISSVVRLPGWAREREAQMEHIAARAGALVAALPPGDEAGV